jgi:NDP-sugar pyrophosphorylase family protein
MGTRLRHLAADIPKHLVDVGGRPFADLQLSWLRDEGVTDVVYCIGHRGQQIHAHVGDGSRFGLRASYVDEGEERRGTGGALRLALDRGLLAEAFMVLYGDSLLDVSLPAVWRAHAEARCGSLMTVLRNDDRWDRSNVVYRGGKVVCYDKSRPAAVQSEMHHIDYGLSVLSREVVARIPPMTTADLADLLHELSVEGQLAGYVCSRRFYEVGTPESVAELRAHLSERDEGSALPR